MLATSQLATTAGTRWIEHRLDMTAVMDSRVQDYLDDKLQSAADLESLDSLLENVREQQELLKKQVGSPDRMFDVQAVLTLYTA